MRFSHLVRALPLLLLATASVALADTLHLKSGVTIDGVVTTRPDGIYEVRAGDRVVLYRPEEVERIERNSRTGHYDEAAARARIAEREEALLRETGLTREQRQRVAQLLRQLSGPGGGRMAARDALAALQEEWDVFAYLARELSRMTPRNRAPVLGVLYHIDPQRALPYVRTALRDSYGPVRAEAILMLAHADERGQVPEIARGLADHRLEVQAAAIQALVQLEARNATPALISLLNHPEQWLGNTSKQALESLWAGRLPDDPLRTAEAWEAFWARNSVTGAIRLDALAPLSDERDEFVHE